MKTLIKLAELNAKHPTDVSSKLALSIPIANISPVDLSLQPKVTGSVREPAWTRPCRRKRFKSSLSPSSRHTRSRGLGIKASERVRCRSRIGNALRAHLAEFGLVAAQGLRNVGELIAIVRDDGDTRLPDVARQVLQVLANQIEQIETAVAGLERQLAWHKTNPVSQRLASIPGIGPIIATAIATTVAEPASGPCLRDTRSRRS
jgi:hypothetical protein